RVAALPDVGHPAVHGDAAAAVDLDLRAGVGHVVPVDRQAGPADVAAQRQADALAERQLPELVVPAARLDDAVDALVGRRGGDAELVGRVAVGRGENPLAVLGWLE